MVNVPSALLPFLCTCVSSIFIGLSAIFIRFADLGPITTGFYRMLISLPFLALWMKWEKREISFYPQLSFREKMGILLAGLFFALNIALWNWSVGHTTIVNATLLNNTAAFFIPLTLWVIFKDKPSVKVFVSAFIGFVGCLCLVGSDLFVTSAYFLGDGVALLSGLMVAFYLIALKQVRERVMTGFLMFWVGVSATLFLGLFAHVRESIDWVFKINDVASIVGQALLVQILGQGLLAYALGRISTTYAGIILFLSPVTGAVVGQLFYDENLNAMKLFGMALVMISIIVMREE